MDKEINSFQKQKVWDIVDRGEKRVLRSRWVLADKYEKDREKIKKARFGI
jgi:hypothetical protein